MVKYNVKRCGPERTFDHGEIKKGIHEGKSNKEIAAEVGCSPGYVGDIRWKSNTKKQWLWECRVC